MERQRFMIRWIDDYEQALDVIGLDPGDSAVKYRYNYQCPLPRLPP